MPCIRNVYCSYKVVIVAVLWQRHNALELLIATRVPYGFATYRDRELNRSSGGQCWSHVDMMSLRMCHCTAEVLQPRRQIHVDRLAYRAQGFAGARLTS